MDRLFSLDTPFWRFAGNTLLLSVLSLAPLLVVFVARTPGFGAMLLEGGPALGRFLRQVLTNGVPVVFVVNYVSFFLFALLTRKDGPVAKPGLILLIDLPARVVVFVVLHGLIYFLSADWFGAFGGDHWLALRVVGPTLVRSVFLENISGVYLYATMVSALPLYIAAIARLERGRGVAGACGGVGCGAGRIVGALLVFGLFAALVTGLAALIGRGL